MEEVDENARSAHPRGNRHANWNVAGRFVIIGRLLLLGTYPSGAYMGNQFRRGDGLMQRNIVRLAAVVACLSFITLAYGAGDSKPVTATAYKNAIRLACIGDSITCGPYPSMLQPTIIP